METMNVELFFEEQKEAIMDWIIGSLYCVMEDPSVPFEKYYVHVIDPDESLELDKPVLYCSILYDKEKDSEKIKDFLKKKLSYRTPKEIDRLFDIVNMFKNNCLLNFEFNEEVEVELIPYNQEINGKEKNTKKRREPLDEEKYKIYWRFLEEVIGEEYFPERKKQS